MTPFPLFLSVVLIVRNQSKDLHSMLRSATTVLKGLVSDYELVVVDNASSDDSVAVLKRLTGEDGLPNVQVYALTKEVDADIASWVGLENALGDFVAVLNPTYDDIEFLPSMLERAVEGTDVVFATNEKGPRQSLAYRLLANVFHSLYRSFNGVNLAREAPSYRLLSRGVVNFILQHPMPQITYRHLPATGGFAKANLRYSAPPVSQVPKHLGENVDRGVRLLVSTTRGPMRLITVLCLFGAGANLVYSVYVIAIALLKSNVAAGWVTLSLQQSGMFFLISLVLLILSEYLLLMVSVNNGPLYHVAQEFTSALMLRRKKLNIEEGPSGLGFKP